MVQVNNNTPIILRVKFTKTGNLQYISHLDLVRTMHKTVVRSKLPLAYTEGFNPKPKMVFAAPLSIGTESVCEFLDIKLKEKIAPELAMELLNRNMTEEMQVVEAYYPESRLTELRWLSYDITLKNCGNMNHIAKLCDQALSEEKIEILKKTKSGEAIVDIRGMIKFASCAYDGENIQIKCILSADPSAFLNPEYIVKYLRKSCGILSSEDLTQEYYSILRCKAYFSDMREFR